MWPHAGFAGSSAPEVFEHRAAMRFNHSQSMSRRYG
jgi:hypothetical protein